MKNYQNEIAIKAVNETDGEYATVMKYKHTVPAQGVVFDLMDPNPEDMSWEFIALCLSRICRYNGGTYFRISVAEHCMHTAILAQLAGEPLEVQLACLIHDAAEAYIGDHVKPLGDAFKAEVVWYSYMKEAWDYAIFHKAGLHYNEVIHAAVKVYDNKACDQEMERDAYLWENGLNGIAGAPHKMIKHYSEATAAHLWLEATSKLMNQLRNQEAARQIEAGLKEVHNG